MAAGAGAGVGPCSRAGLSPHFFPQDQDESTGSAENSPTFFPLWKSPSESRPCYTFRLHIFSFFKN